MHDVSKVVLGGTRSSVKSVACYNSDPATFLAGLAVRQSSTVNVLSLTSGFKNGISLGRSLSDTKKTDVCLAGLDVPLRASLKRSTGLVTVTNFTNLAAGDTITVGATGFVGQAGAATPGTATFQSAGSLAAAATSLAAQINAHATANTLVYAIASSATVRLYSKVEGAGVGNDVALSYTDASPTSVGATLSELSAGKLAGGSDTLGDIDYIAVGAKAYINDVTGKADVAMTGFSTVSDAIYKTIEITGVDEDGGEVAACLVDMAGGL